LEAGAWEEPGASRQGFRVWPSGGSQMLQDCDAVFIRPIMKNFAEEKDCDVFVTRWLRFEEIVALRNPNFHAS